MASLNVEVVSVLFGAENGMAVPGFGCSTADLHTGASIVVS